MKKASVDGGTIAYLQNLMALIDALEKNGVSPDVTNWLKQSYNSCFRNTEGLAEYHAAHANIKASIENVSKTFHDLRLNVYYEDVEAVRNNPEEGRL